VKLIVDISDARCSKDPHDVLVTYALGSCIGVALYDPKTQVGGMLHYQLPSAKMDKDGVNKNPMMYGDTGMTHLLKAMESQGADRKRMKVKIAGGAQIMNDAKMFSIGKRNYAAIRQFLWKHGMFIDAEDVGGKSARTLYLSLEDGRVMIKQQGKNKEL
jgi:chemotaxis protein CheD